MKSNFGEIVKKGLKDLDISLDSALLVLNQEVPDERSRQELKELLEKLERSPKQ